MTEKRYYVRIPANIECECRFDNKKLPATIVDLSADGMQIVLESENELDFINNQVIVVKYHTNMEIGEKLSPISIACYVRICSVRERPDPDMIVYELHCQIREAFDSWD